MDNCIASIGRANVVRRATIILAATAIVATAVTVVAIAVLSTPGLVILGLAAGTTAVVLTIFGTLTALAAIAALIVLLVKKSPLLPPPLSNPPSPPSVNSRQSLNRQVGNHQRQQATQAASVLTEKMKKEGVQNRHRDFCRKELDRIFKPSPDVDTVPQSSPDKDNSYDTKLAFITHDFATVEAFFTDLENNFKSKNEEAESQIAQLQQKQEGDQAQYQEAQRKIEEIKLNSVLFLLWSLPTNDPMAQENCPEKFSAIPNLSKELIITRLKEDFEEGLELTAILQFLNQDSARMDLNAACALITKLWTQGSARGFLPVRAKEHIYAKTHKDDTSKKFLQFKNGAISHYAPSLTQAQQESKTAETSIQNAKATIAQLSQSIEQRKEHVSAFSEKVKVFKETLTPQVIPVPRTPQDGVQTAFSVAPTVVPQAASAPPKYIGKIEVTSSGAVSLVYFDASDSSFQRFTSLLMKKLERYFSMAVFGDQIQEIARFIVKTTEQTTPPVSHSQKTHKASTPNEVNDILVKAFTEFKEELIKLTPGSSSVTYSTIARSKFIKAIGNLLCNFLTNNKQLQDLIKLTVDGPEKKEDTGKVSSFFLKDHLKKIKTTIATSKALPFKAIIGLIIKYFFPEESPNPEEVVDPLYLQSINHVPVNFAKPVDKLIHNIVLRFIDSVKSETITAILDCVYSVFSASLLNTLVEMSDKNFSPKSVRAFCDQVEKLLNVGLQFAEKELDSGLKAIVDDLLALVASILDEKEETFLAILAGKNDQKQEGNLLNLVSTPLKRVAEELALEVTTT